MFRKETGILWLTLVVFLALTIWPTAFAGPSKPLQNPVEMQTEWQITPEARITQFNWTVGEHKKQPSLIFTVGIENQCDKPQRYRLNIFLMDSDKASGYLVPRKGKPPVLEPGKSATVKIPFINTVQSPKNLLVVVKTVGY